MKICVYNVTSTMDLPGTTEVGGTEEFSFRIAETWHAQGHETVIVGGRPRAGASHRPTPVPLRLFSCVETRSVPDLGSRFRKLVQRVHFGWGALPWVRDGGFDLVLAFKPYDLIPFHFAGLRARSKVLFRFGGTDFFPTDRFWRDASDRFFANSAVTAEQVGRRFGCECPVISNGAAIPASAARIGHNTRTLLAVGRLVSWKGFADLILAMPPLRARTGFRLVIAGEGEDRPRLEALADELGVRDRVEFAGRIGRSELEKRMLEGALFVQPSAGHDSCPNAMFDAMAAGLPVLLSSKVGLPEGFGPGRHGVIYPAGDHQALVESIVDFLAAPTRYAEMGRAGRELISGRHTMERASAQILELAGLS